MREEFCFSEWDVFRPEAPVKAAGVSSSRSTVLFSMQGLGAWLLTRDFMCASNRGTGGNARLDGWQNFIHGFGRVAKMGFRQLRDADAVPSFEVDGVHISITTSMAVDCLPLTVLWPTFLDEFDELGCGFFKRFMRCIPFIV